MSNQTYTYILTNDFEPMRNTYKKNLIFLISHYESKLSEYTNILSLAEKRNNVTKEELDIAKRHIIHTNQRLGGLYRQQEDIDDNLIRRLRHQLLNLD